MQTRQFVRRSRIAAPVERVFHWHELPGAFEKLVPPGEPVHLLAHIGGIRDGARVELSIGPPLFRLRWVAEHSGYIENRKFIDTQVRGPFARWEHTHIFEANGPDACYLEDRIAYELPLGFLVGWLFGGLIERKLERLFEYRHQVTREENEAVSPSE